MNASEATVHRHARISPVPQVALLSSWGEWTGAVAANQLIADGTTGELLDSMLVA